MNTLSLRITAAVIMMFLIAWGYWWLILAAAIFFLFAFTSYYEIMLWGVIVDALYAGPSQGSYDYSVHFGLFISIALLFIAIFLKKRLAFYS